MIAGVVAQRSALVYIQALYQPIGDLHRSTITGNS